MKTFVVGDLHGRRAQLRQLLELIPRDPAVDRLVLLGDLLDRGADIPGLVTDVIALRDGNPERITCLRGNHEQMLLDFVDEGATLWLHAAVGSDQTIEQYTGQPISIRTEQDFQATRRAFAASLPRAHLDFLRSLPLYDEDEFALYVHAGLDGGKHPRETTAQHLLWSRNPDFFKHYTGKPCVFGHTPTPLLPLRGRIGRHGIYIAHSAIGIDTGYTQHSPLTCLQLPDLRLYQAFADGHTAIHRLTSLVPERLRAMRKQFAQPQPAHAGA